MLHHLLTASAAPTLAQSTRRWLYGLGGLGFIPLGFIDASIVPIPGSMDVLTIVLCARRQQLWPYYAFMATLGSVLGALATYRLARKGGKEMLARRLSKQRMKSVNATFERWGFGAVAVPALLPPPIPMVPFVLAAGAMQYPAKRFVAAMTLGRAVRFTLLALLGARYGRGIVRFVTQHGHPFAITAIVLVVAGLSFLLVLQVKKHRSSRA